MTITLKLEDDLVAELNDRAQKAQLSAEELAIRILTEALVRSTSASPSEVVARIQATVPNPVQVRPATVNLADLLCAAPDDPNFNIESWNSKWSAIEAELKATTRANDAAEGRGLSD